MLFSCSTDNVGKVNVYDDEDLITEEIFFELNAAYGTYSVDSSDLMYSAKITYNLSTDKVVDLEADKELLAALEMTDVQFKDTILDEIETNIEAYGSHSDCINYCNENLERGQGRGRCKLNCWVDTIKEITAIVFSKNR